MGSGCLPRDARGLPGVAEPAENAGRSGRPGRPRSQSGHVRHHAEPPSRPGGDGRTASPKRAYPAQKPRREMARRSEDSRPRSRRAQRPSQAPTNEHPQRLWARWTRQEPAARPALFRPSVAPTSQARRSSGHHVKIRRSTPRAHVENIRLAPVEVASQHADLMEQPSSFRRDL
jgi:hypothetical protein